MTQQSYPQQQPEFSPQREPKKNWFARHKLLTGIGIAVIAIALISAIAGGGGSSSDDPAADVPSAAEVQDAGSEDAAAQDSATDESGSDAAEAEIADAAPGIGDAVTSGDLEFTVTSVEDGGTEVGSEYLSETAQGEFLLVHISVTNTGNEAATFFGDNQKLIDSEGREHETDGAASLYLEDNDTLFTEINPGNTVDGILVFDLPADTEPVELVVSGGLFDSDVAISLDGAME